MGALGKIMVDRGVKKYLFAVVVLCILSFLALPLRAQEGYEGYFEKAKQAAEQGKFEEAIKLYEKTLEINPDLAPAYMGLGRIYEQRTDDVEAVAWYFQSALRIDPGNIEAYEALGRIYQQANQPEMSVKYFKKILEIDPNSLGAQYSLAWTYLAGKSEPAEAVRYFQNVLAKAKIPMAYYGLGIAYSQLGDHAQVLEVVTELKSLGQIELAAKLENSIRQPWAPTSQTIQVPVSQPSSSIVRSAPPAPAPPPEKPSIGTMPIRLRGKLYNIDNNAGPAPSGY